MVCPVLLELMGVQLGKWWNTQIKVNSTQVHEHMGHPATWVNKMTERGGKKANAWHVVNVENAVADNVNYLAVVVVAVVAGEVSE